MVLDRCWWGLVSSRLCLYKPKMRKCNLPKAGFTPPNGPVSHVRWDLSHGLGLLGCAWLQERCSWCFCSNFSLPCKQILITLKCSPRLEASVSVYTQMFKFPVFPSWEFASVSILSTPTPHSSQHPLFVLVSLNFVPQPCRWCRPLSIYSSICYFTSWSIRCSNQSNSSTGLDLVYKIKEGPHLADWHHLSSGFCRMALHTAFFCLHCRALLHSLNGSL